LRERMYTFLDERYPAGKCPLGASPLKMLARGAMDASPEKPAGRQH
jgi:hypothetical protein